jgi:hypothetical protein
MVMGPGLQVCQSPRLSLIGGMTDPLFEGVDR